MAQRKNPELDALHQSILRKMLQLPENKACADCKAPSPRWASTNLGIFLCISCSGIHRKLGTHISQVRSTTLDTWTPAQINHFKKLGNAKAAAYFEACLPEGFRRPSSADSMQMERFIRDKYEKKRYITVENGGLGGASSGRQQKSVTQSNSFPQPKFPTPTTSTLGPRPIQTMSPSHVSRPMGRKAMPLSYGDTFRSSSITRSKHMANAQRRLSDARVLGKPGNTIQRATTVREILKMGFSADVAARAAEAGNGDLQRAVDWVLENCSSAHEPPKKKQEEPIQDLLDFSDVDWGKKPNGQNVWGESHSKTHTSTTATRTTTTTSTVQNDFEDFADFGAFESALPTTQAPKVAAPSPAPGVGSNTLSGSISALYTGGAATANASISKATNKQHAVKPQTQHSQGMQSSLDMFDAFQTGFPKTTVSTPPSNQSANVNVAGGYSSSLFQNANSSSSAVKSNLQGNSKMRSPFGQPAVTQPIFSQSISPLKAPLSSPLRSGFNIQSTALHGGPHVTNNLRQVSPKALSPVSHPPPSQSIPSFVSFSTSTQKTPKGKSSPTSQPATLSNAYSFTQLNGGQSPTQPLPPPPPPALIGVLDSALDNVPPPPDGPPPPPALSGVLDSSLDDVPPPPEGPPPRQDDVNVAEPNGKHAEVSDIPEESPVESTDEKVGNNNTEEVEEPEEEDPFAALSMMALSSAKAKMKS